MVYLVGLIFTLTSLYFISVDSKGTVVTVENAPGVTEKSVTLGNIRNDPRDVVEIGVEVNNDNQVLEDPEGAQVNNKVDSEQVAEPPKNLIYFPGKYAATKVFLRKNDISLGYVLKAHQPHDKRPLCKPLSMLGKAIKSLRGVMIN